MKRYIRSSVSLKHIGDEWFSDTAEQKDYHKYQILRDDTKVGSIEIVDMFNEDNDVCYVERIDVDDEYQNQGIGTEVLNKILWDMGYRSVVVAPDNPDAARLYERLGSELNGTIDDVDFTYNDQGYGVYVI